MSQNAPTLHMLCGKIAAGKSTLAARLSAEEQTVLISEDAWLGSLFADQMKTPRDYVRCAAKLQAVMGPHVTALLNARLSVVLDFPANTVENRLWMRGLFETSNAEHKLHVLDAPDSLCLQRLHQRNADGEHPFATTEAQFYQITKYYVPPTPIESFDIVNHSMGQ